MTTKSVQLNSALRNFGLPLAALFCLLSAIFALKWYLANAASANADQKEIAEAAVFLAPNDPQTHYALAVLREQSFLFDDLPKSVEAFEQATALSPNDYRLWFALGRARERGGDSAGAEKALRKASELAPNYAQIQWALGNVLLRQGKTEEAFAQIRKSVESDKNLAAPAVTTVWQVLDGDAAQISRNLGESPHIKSALATFLAKDKRYDEALQIWSGLPEADKRLIYKQSGEQLLSALLDAKKFADALRLQTQISAADAPHSAPENFTNGGFETALNPENRNIFDWQFGEGAQPLIGPNNEQKHGGSQSLLMIFNSPTGKDFRAVSQTIVVEPNRNYTFRTFYRSELKTSGTLKWEILDAATDKTLAQSEAIAANSDWAPLALKFTTAPATEAVRVRLARAACSTTVCPISGKVWFDDFSLEK